MDGRKERRVLVVCGEAEVCSRIEALLQGLPRSYEVLPAANGPAGLELARTRAIDCIVLDYDLDGDISGLGFLDAIPAPGGGVTHPVVMMSTSEEDVSAGAALKRGAQDWLIREGLTPAALARAIENAIEKFAISSELIRSRAALEQRNLKLEELRAQLQEKITELADATNAKDKFMAVMSHEMRTPLNAIIGYADLLEMQVDGPLGRGQGAHVDRIQVASRYLLDLINNVLDLSRADAGGIELDLRPVDPSAVLEEVVALLDKEAQQKKILLVIEPLPPGLPNAYVDLNRLRQILTNLVGNAIKFTEEGEVRVRCEARGDTVAIHVSDTGIGIDPDIVPLVFNEFFQARGDLTREKGGSGLGLAISRRLARLMGGEIDAVSRVGEGSEFVLTVPAAGSHEPLRAADVERHAQRMEIHATPAPGGAVTVIAFGELEDTLAELARRVKGSVRLLWTTDPDEVPILAARERAAMVVLDISDRDGNGWRVANTLQNKPELTQTAVLLLPSLPDVKADEQTGGIDVGWLSLVPKPFTAVQLQQAVDSAVRGGGLEQQNGTVEVLVVDDDPDSRRVATRFLTEAKLTVREAVDGESALHDMERQPPDAVVLDLMMPVLDGFGVLATMRANPRLARIPVVVLTAKSLTEAERQFLSRTTVRVLQKGEHRLADVAALVLRAAAGTRATPQLE
ncbi:MAG TPA: response regulator [Longimicrobiales bacterium]